MIELLPYQKEDVARIEGYDGRILNALEMGLGKTLETLWVLKNNPQWLPALVICPASLKFNWKHEASKHFGMESTVCEGKTPPKDSQFSFDFSTPLTIINYDILRNWIPWLKTRGFKTVVCDEIQAVQNSRTIRTKAVKEISGWVKHLMMLSGTPLSNRPAELFPTLNMLWPKEYPSFTAFAHRHCKPRLTHWGWKYDGAERLGELHEKLTRLGMIRRKKADVLKDLPEKVRRIIPCEMSRPEEYHEASTHFIQWLKKNMAHRVRSASRAEALTQIGYLLRLTAQLKIRTPIEWSNQFLENTNEKLVIFGVHQKAIEAYCRRIERKYVMVDGSTNNQARHEAVQQFQSDPDTRVFIGSRTAWAGVTLTAASTIAATELWWRPGDMAQMEDRIHRIGQKSVSFINYFVAADTIEERLCRIIQEKQKVLSAVLDGGETPEDINLYELLLDELQITL